MRRASQRHVDSRLARVDDARRRRARRAHRDRLARRRGLRVALGWRRRIPTCRCASPARRPSTRWRAIPANAIAKATARYGDYWSPVIDGERATIEIEAAADARLGRRRRSRSPRMSHLLVSPRRAARRRRRSSPTSATAGACNIDVKCSPVPQDAVTEASRSRNGQARLHGAVRRHPRAPARCSTTRSQSTRRTSSAPTTASMAPRSRARSTRAGSSPRGVRRRRRPPTSSSRPAARRCSAAARTGTGRWCASTRRRPTDLSFRGWTAPIRSPVTTSRSLHHPSGDLKKCSRGQALTGPGRLRHRSDGTASSRASSGTGHDRGRLHRRLVRDAWRRQRVRGARRPVRRRCACTIPRGPDYFSHFDTMLPVMRQYLTPNAAIPNGRSSRSSSTTAASTTIFMSTNPVEIDNLDSGRIVGWDRTGFRFLVYDRRRRARTRCAASIARLRSATRTSTRPSPAECAATAAAHPVDWIYESPNVFYVQLPDTDDGAVPGGHRSRSIASSTPRTINHRTRPSSTMARRNASDEPWWTPEGYGPGPYYPIMCRRSASVGQKR